MDCDNFVEVIVVPKTGEIKEIERKLKKATCAKCWSSEIGYDFRTKEWNCNGCGFKWVGDEK